MKRILLLVLLFAAAQVASILAVDAAPSDLDPTWGNGGIVVAPLPHQEIDLHSQPDGKVIVSGYFSNQFSIARFNQNGTLDESFGTNGRVSIQGNISESALQPDGKIVVGGFNFLARYNQNGTLDITFGTNGTVNTTFGFANDLIVQPDGKIIVIGGINAAFAIARFNSNGSLDTSFGTGGIIIVDFTTGNDLAVSVVLQSDGKIIVGGTVNINVEGRADLGLVRLMPNGSLDSTFGAGGKVITNLTNWVLGDELYDIALQPDGKIIASGMVVDCGPEDCSPSFDGHIIRYNTDGSKDLSFLGIWMESVGDSYVTVQPNGKILVAHRGFIGNQHTFAVSRFNQNGSPDPTFGTNGRVITSIGNNPYSYLKDIVLQPDGKIVVAGSTNGGIAIVRYLGDSTAQQRATQFDFDGDNKADIAVFRPENGTWYRLNSSNNSFVATPFGIANDQIVPADYDGDRRTDHAVFRNGEWFILQSSNNTLRSVSFGQTGDAPVPGDYDADGKADVAVFRQGNWYILNSANNSFRAEQFGAATDKPIVGDFDGDARQDLAVFRDGNWFVQRSTQGFFAAQFGSSADKPVAADYDADGRTDLAVFRAGSWYLLRSSEGFAAIQFGVATDKAVPADYDGDNRADVAVYRDGNWFIQQSSNNQLRAVAFGAATDVPVPTAFLP